MDNKRDLYLTVSGILVAVAILVVLIGVLRNNNFIPLRGLSPTPGETSIKTAPFEKLTKFKSDVEFRDYMEQSGQGMMYGGTPFAAGALRMDKAVTQNETGTALTAPGVAGGAPERVSGTNTQVLGIDEPDIVKTDGSSIYYSSPFRLYRGTPVPVPMSQGPGDATGMAPIEKMPAIRPDIYPIPQQQSSVMVIRAFPPSSLKNLSEIDANGDLLLSRNVLVVFNEQDYNKRAISGYDISNPSSPQKKWTIPYKQNTYRLQARMYKDKLYLITRVDTGGGSPCPMQPFDLKSEGLIIPCTEIYHPTVPVSNDSVYTLARIEPATGKIEDSVSFVGSSMQTEVYMSKNAVYVSYQYAADLSQIMYSFVSQNSDLFNTTVIDKLGKLQGYDLSPQTKMIEVNTIITRFMSGLDQDKRLTFENNLQNRARKFMAAHARELDKTGIVKISADSLTMTSTGSIPGQVLNQFSFDEYKGNLRVATTVAQNSWIGGFGQVTDSFSDVYVLDGNLNTLGSVKDLGKKERIYSVRFMGDRGYVVTFRQTDPFYVLDLSNASNPELKGELKIPGYSSYLHPLTTDIIVGLGRDNGNVKLSLFNVADPANPQEIDNYQLSEYWSEALDNHHAFLADEAHQVFFMPGSRGGYVFSYAGNKLSLAKAVADMQVQRAVYINNYLYIIGQNNLVVLDENTWGKVAELSL